jgi:hypothetical protein
VGTVHTLPADLSTVLWGGLAVVVIGFLVPVPAATRRPSVEDLDPVSSQWIVEHRGRQSEPAPQ